MADDILYRGVFRLRRNNRDDEDAYRFLENLPSGVKKNDIIRRALLEYIRNQECPNQSGKMDSDRMKILEKRLEDMEERLMNAINTIQATGQEVMGEERNSTAKKGAESEIPMDALSFLANLNNRVQIESEG